ncbi:MAG: YybH family protein, partial [Planctomycetota bacterium]
IAVDYLQVASSITADGYICEVSIPHSEITPLDWSVGSIIGFHPCIDDTDIDGGDTEYQMSWTGLPAHDQSLGFGHMVLSADSVPASSQLIAYEPFDYPANGLSGNDGGSGWDGAWDGGQQVTAPGLDFSPLSVEGNKATVVGSDSFRNLPETMGDNETQLWISFIGQADQQPGADMWGGVSFHEPGESLFLGVPWQPGPDDKVWGLDTKGDDNRLTEIPITEKILFVARIDFNTEGDNETVTAWAKSINDPNPWDLTDETAFAQYTTRNIEFSRVRVAGAQPVNIDEIRLSTAPPSELVAQAADIAALNEALNQYAVAVNTGDFELWLSLHSDDVVKMPPDTPATIGIEELRANNEALFDNFTLEMALFPEETHADGDLGYTWGNYTFLLTPKAGGEPIYMDGKYLTISKRQPDGSWKISHDCFNSNVPPPPPPQ